VSSSGGRRLAGPWLGLAAGTLIALCAVVTGHVRTGGYLLALSFALMALARLLLPAAAAGAIAVRSRPVDVLGLSLAAVGAAVLTSTLKLTS